VRWKVSLATERAVWADSDQMRLVAGREFAPRSQRENSREARELEQPAYAVTNQYFVAAINRVGTESRGISLVSWQELLQQPAPQDRAQAGRVRKCSVASVLAGADGIWLGSLTCAGPRDDLSGSIGLKR
jgi:predicted amidohydrolase